MGKLRSKSADRKKKGRDEGDASDANNMRGDSQFIHVKNVMLSQDSGNCSLNTSTTSTTDTRKSAKSCDNLNQHGKNDLCVIDSEYRGRYSMEGGKQSLQGSKSVII